MINQEEIKEIKNTTEKLLQKMTMEDFSLELKPSPEGDFLDLDIKLKEPQFLIGEGGQTLMGLERVLRIILSKGIKKKFYLKLDINGYKKNKIDYLKKIAKESADEVSLTKKSKILPPMPAFERRVIHVELSQRRDIIAESQGDDADRHIVINPVDHSKSLLSRDRE